MSQSAQRYVEVSPEGALEVLSQLEVNALLSKSEGGLYPLLRRCALAVLTTGSLTDDAAALMREYEDFDITILQVDRGVRLGLTNPPAAAFVDGRMIRGTRELLFAVLRDIVFYHAEFTGNGRYDFSRPEHVTNIVFHILRNATVVSARTNVDVVVCWGGHAISRTEYLYTKQVGYELGLRGFHICTGCGPGAMKGPMKGATIGHSKQRIRNGRYIGISEPGIIAAESPNPIVNELVIMPDMEKRLEAFVRTGHGIIVFPGGVGTAEEILYLLGILLHPDNAGRELPLVLTGPAGSAEYFERIDAFIRATLGDAAAARYEVVIDDPARVATLMQAGLDRVETRRRRDGDAFYFNWQLHIDPDFQQPFAATHENMAALDLSETLPSHELAANLRRAFSGIVAGNIREETVQCIETHGPFQLQGSPRVSGLLDDLLRSFVKQKRMKLFGDYKPCFEVIASKP
ncbi:MAG: nucleotide 5'-monophosphate nucleosidase PpnN [Pseudomonadota bacterium]